MKQGKKLKLWMKLMLKAKKLDPDMHLYTKDIPGELHIIHKHAIKERVIQYDKIR